MSSQPQRVAAPPLASSGKENQPPGPVVGMRRKAEEDVFQSGPRKRQYVAKTVILKQRLIFALLRMKTDPLVSHGRHFGRTIQAFCKVYTLLREGLSREIQMELGRLTEDELSIRCVFHPLPLPFMKLNHLQRLPRAPSLPQTCSSLSDT